MQDLGWSDVNYTFLGWVDESGQFLSNLDVLIVPFNQAGKPLNILEAFSNETLVICSAIPKNQTLVEDGITVILFEKTNSVFLASKIGEVVSDIERFYELKINAKINLVNRSDNLKGLYKGVYGERL